MKIVIFVAKTTGLTCLQWFLGNNKADDLNIFVAEPDSELIADYLTQKQIPFNILADTDPSDQLMAGSYDWLLNLWSPYIFKQPLLDCFKNSLNLHPSYLPYGRGRDPVVWAVKNGDPAGASLHVITAGVDEGPIWAQIRVPYECHETGAAVYERVETAIIDLFRNHWLTIKAGDINPSPQGQEDLPTRRRKDLLKDALIYDDAFLASKTVRTILAHDFSENGYTSRLKSNGKSYTISLKLTPINEDD